MSGEPPKENQGESEYIRLRRNLLNIGIFAAEILLLAIAGPALVRFFLPVIIGWLIAQLANPLVHFLEKHLHIVRKHSSFGVIFGAIFLIVALCYYAALWIWQEAGELVQRLPVYYQALVQAVSYRHLTLPPT